MKRWSVLRIAGWLSLWLLVLSIPIGCTSAKRTSPNNKEDMLLLPDRAYYRNENLKTWIDTETGYDTTRKWSIDGKNWPVMLVMSPSQSPQLIMGMKYGIFQDAMKPFGISLEVSKLDGPPRVFHALERSQWPFVYMPIAVFTDYCRGAKNQGGAGGLQYVAIAGSTAGGGYQLIARPNIKRISDLKGKKVGLTSSSPVQDALLQAEAKKFGLKVGSGSEDIHVAYGETGAQFNKYLKGEYDATISWSIYKGQLLKQGSHVLTDFTDINISPNYTILAVEREVLEKRPDVVKAFLEAHYKANKLAVDRWKDETIPEMYKSWSDFFAVQNTKWSGQRTVPSMDAYEEVLGNMWPEMRLDRKFIEACFKTVDERKRWDWNGKKPDISRLVNYDLFNEVLKAEGQRTQ